MLVHVTNMSSNPPFPPALPFIKTDLEEDGEEDDNQGGGDKHVLLWKLVLVQEGHQRETDGAT